MKIRLAKEKDTAQIIQLIQEHTAFEKAEFELMNKAELLTHHFFHSQNIAKCIVVEQNSELVGYATFMKQFSTWDACFYLYLCTLYLKEQTRGKGIGYQIMQQVKEYARAENCTMIQWQTPSFNTDAISFYKKLGATSKAKERFFWTI